MKRLLFVILICMPLIGFNAAAQRNYLGFSLGTSMPKGDFAATGDLVSEGYAIPGFTVRFEGFYHPIRIIGIGGMLNFGSLYARRDLYLEQLLDYAYYESGLPLSGIPPVTDEVDFESGFWNYVNLMVGPEISVPFGRFQAGLRALGGLSMAVYPRREFTHSAGLADLEAMVKGTSVALAWSYGGSLLYRSRAGTGIKLSADYLSTSAGCDFELDLITDAGTFEDTKTGDIDIESLSITLGFFYVF